MRGYGYECDFCNMREVVAGDAFLGADPLPAGWVRVVTADGGTPETHNPAGADFCSWRCLQGEASLVEERRFVEGEKAKRAAMEAGLVGEHGVSLVGRFRAAHCPPAALTGRRPRAETTEPLDASRPLHNGSNRAGGEP